MALYLSLLVFVCLCSLAASAPAPTNLVVDLGYAKYQGKAEPATGTNAWYGMPYAANASAENRFRPPRQIEQFGNLDPSQIIDATATGPLCVQGYPGWSLGDSDNPPVVGGVEDCLVLDVVVPQTPASSILPVMVEIHGGGYAVGCSECYDGHALMQHAAGAFIYVTLQYRLGPYGFLAAEEVMADGTANAGLLDQRMAIEWVYSHIGAFGGDPNQITISGGSAGGGSVSAQMILYGGNLKRSFRAAIIEYPWWQPYHDQKVYEHQYQQLLNYTGCTDLPCLRNVSEDTMRKAAELSYDYGYDPDRFFGYGDFYYGPAVDGNIIRKYPTDAFIDGTYQPVPLLTNHDGWEGYVFSNGSEKTQAEEMADLQLLFPNADAAFFDQLFEQYPAAAFNSTLFQRSQIFGDAIVNCPTMLLAFAMSLQSQPVWKMRFDAGNEVHGATKDFLFGATDADSNGNNATLGAMMKDWYASFVVHNDPNAQSWTGVKKPNWPMYYRSPHDLPTVMDVEVGNVGQITDPDWNNNCIWWLQQWNVTTN